MSDEPTPPPLRLKPRVRPDETAGNPPPQPAVVPEVTGQPAESGPKLRLKPKLNAEAANTAPAQPSPAGGDAATPQEPAPASAPTIRLKPRLSTEPPTAAVEATPASIPPVAPTPASAEVHREPESPKIRLKPKTAGTATVPPTPPAAAVPPAAQPPVIANPPAEASAPAAPPVTSAKRPTPPPFPLVATPGDTAKKLPPPPVPHLRAPREVGEEELVRAAQSQKPAASGRKTYVWIAAGLVPVAALAVYAFLRSPTPPPARPTAPAPGKTAPKPASPAPAAKPGPTPSATLNEIAAAPARAIGKAQAVVAARRQNEQDRVNALADGQEAPDQRALNTPPPSTFNAPPAQQGAQKSTAVAELAPGVTATTTTSSEVVGPASAAFRAWVASAKINGVFQGSPARVLLNGRTARVGQTVDDTLGILLDRVDPATKSIVFRDATGATVTRHY